MIDFVSCFEPQSLEQDAGSKRQQAVFKLAKWFFDRGDGARLTAGMPP